MTEQNGAGRSSATDELRAELTRRGVKWAVPDESWNQESITYWKVGSIKWVAFESENGTLWLNCNSVTDLTPEQAIAATLGRGECHVKAAKKIGDSFGFSLSCGHSMVNPFNDHPDYCPWCGAKVVDE